MFTRPDGLTDGKVVDAVVAGWDLRVHHIEYAAVGFGSYHWWITDAWDGRWFVSVDDVVRRAEEFAEPTTAALRRLSAALSTARRLRDAGLEFVVAPEPTSRGSVIHPPDSRHAVALYAFVEGTSYPWGRYESRDERLAVLDLLSAVHAAPESTRRDAHSDDFTVQGSKGLREALGDLERPWDGGPYSERARTLAIERLASIEAAFARYERLVDAVAAAGDRVVITHGEPHRANTIRTTSGPVLIDWDTALLAPPERDLWALVGEDPQIVEEYGRRTGTAPDPTALDLYRLRWDLTEIAIYVPLFRGPHVDSDDTRNAWGGLTRSIEVIAG